MLKVGQKYLVTIKGMTQDACGIGVVEGIKIFVEGALPNETVEVEISRIEKDFAASRLIKIIDAKYERTEPICPHYGFCGGCRLQHIKYNYQLRLKREIVCEALGRIAGIDESIVRETIGMDNPVRYRNKAGYRVGSKDGMVRVGFTEVRNHSIIDINECPMQHELSARVIDAVRQYMIESGAAVYNFDSGEGLIRHVVVRVSFKTDEVMVIIVANDDVLPELEKLVSILCNKVPEVKSIYLNINREKTNQILGSECMLIYGEETINDCIGELRFDISPLSFFQVNPVQTQVLYDKVLEYANLNGDEVVFDLYSGIGTIALYLANKAKMVYGIESVEQAVDNAGKNAVLNGIKNVEFVAGRVQDVLPEFMDKGIKPDLVVLDPPRKGCNKRVLDMLHEVGISKVVFVSCNPATLARDIFYLQSGGYRVKEIQPVDMFPHTGHVESLVLMTRVEK